jgi:hypothetical protein
MQNVKGIGELTMMLPPQPLVRREDSYGARKYLALVVEVAKQCNALSSVPRQQRQRMS